jgi:hypothetical protein
MPKISIIIPLAPKEKAWKALLPDLNQLQNKVEILFIITDEKQKESINAENHFLPSSQPITATPIIRWIVSSTAGRAQQLNMGAKVACHEFLWFLHADSRFTGNTFSALLNSIKLAPDALHYFNLKFTDNLFLMKLNAIGVWLRSHLLGSPFGDQGFCIRKSLFNKAGKYPENVTYGEDHLFVWAAKRQGVKLRCTGASLSTSARKYIDHGWLSTTLQHQFLWFKQVIPEWLKQIRHKITRAQ